MDKILDDYLEKTDKYLRPMPAGERVDIIKEIKSQMFQPEAEKHLTPAQITERLCRACRRQHLRSSLHKHTLRGAAVFRRHRPYMRTDKTDWIFCRHGSLETDR